MLNKMLRAGKCLSTVKNAGFMYKAFPASGTQSMRFFSADVAVNQEADGEVVEERSLNERVGADDVFSEQKHAYVLTFPWNFDEVISQAQMKHRGLSESSYWNKFVTNSGSQNDFNILFRKFHQACSWPDEDGIEDICEERLAAAVNSSVERIHFHGLDIEMANLTVKNQIRVLDV